MIFHNATLITMNATRHVLFDGAVAVTGSQIAGVGKSRDILSRFPGKEHIDCKGNVLMPGLVDTHVHTAQAMIRGCADDLGLFDWLVKRVWMLQGHYTEEDASASAALCVLEMIKSGTTAFIECMLAGQYGFDGVAQVIAQSGMRAAISKTVMDNQSYGLGDGRMCPGMLEDGETCIEQALAGHERWNGAADGRIQVWFGPRSPGAVSPDLYRRIGELARERHMGITIHFSEVREEVEYIITQGFRSPIEFGLQLGLLGPHSVIAHCVWTDELDWKILAETGTHVSHNPASNAKTAAGIAPVEGMLKAGVNVSLACDGGPSNNTYDMIRDMRLASYLANLRAKDPTSVPAETVLEMATINGAKAMGLGAQIGSIEEGKKADFIVINMDAPHLTPAWDPISTIVYAATGSDVDTVVIDGRIVMRERRILTLDEHAILSSVRGRYRAVGQRAGLAIGPRWPVL